MSVTRRMTEESDAQGCRHRGIHRRAGRVRSTDEAWVVTYRLDNLYVTRKGCTRLLAVNKPMAYLCHNQATERFSGLTYHCRRQKDRRWVRFVSTFALVHGGGAFSGGASRRRWSARRRRSTSWCSLRR